MRSWEDDGCAAMLAACLRCGALTIIADPARGAYRVCDAQHAAMWADDLPEGGVPALLEAFSLLVCPCDRAAFRRAMAPRAGDWCGRLVPLEPGGSAPARVRKESLPGHAVRLTVARLPRRPSRDEARQTPPDPQS